jgi:hypothetical protein
LFSSSFQIFRKAKDLFDKPQIDILGGFSFVKASGRDARAFNVDSAAVESANDVQSREEAIENYVAERAKNFVQERSLNLDLAAAARSVISVIPTEVKSQMRSLIVEGRGKKKILKSLLPLVGILKLKMVGLAIIKLFGLLLLAKKALFISLIALALSKFLLIKKLLSGGGGKKGGEEVVAYHSSPSSGGWSSGGGGGSGGSSGWDSYSSGGGGGGGGGYGEYASHSQPAHSIAYAAHKP